MITFVGVYMYNMVHFFMMKSLVVYLIIVYIDTYLVYGAIQMYILTSVDDVIIIRATLCRCPAVLHLAMQEFHSEAKSISNAHWIKTVL